MAKNAPTVQNENALKRVKMAKNRQKSAEIIKKSISPTTTSPKGHFLPKNAHKKENAFGEKKYLRLLILDPGGPAEG